MALWNSGMQQIKTKWEQVKHIPSPGICRVWELPHMEGIVCVFALCHGNSAGSGQVGSCGSQRVAQDWELGTRREFCPACGSQGWQEPRG